MPMLTLGLSSILRRLDSMSCSLPAQMWIYEMT